MFLLPIMLLLIIVTIIAGVVWFVIKEKKYVSKIENAQNFNYETETSENENEYEYDNITNEDEETLKEELEQLKEQEKILKREYESLIKRINKRTILLFFALLFGIFFLHCIVISVANLSEHGNAILSGVFLISFCVSFGIVLHKSNKAKKYIDNEYLQQRNEYEEKIQELTRKISFCQKDE